MANEQFTTVSVDLALDRDVVLSQSETPCLICGEGVPVFGQYSLPKICEKCKAAVMKVREQDGK